MKLIIWTLGWILVTAIDRILNAKARSIDGEKYTTLKVGLLIEQIIFLAIWIIGMVKFWTE